MQIRDEKPFHVGDWLVESSLNRISREGDNTTLPPRVMDLLVCLRAHAGEVVSIDDIIEQVWDGAFVTNGSIYNCINELRDALGDHKDTPEYIETISKRGYRLIAKTSGQAPIGLPATPNAQAAPISATRLVYTLTGLIVLALGWLAYQAQIAPNGDVTSITVSPGAEDNVLPHSIAVLPFTNLSPDPDDAYFAAGMHEEVLNQLAKIEDLSVIARTTMMGYAAGDKSVPEVGAELNVGAVMEGSVRYAGNRVRIAVQLNDAQTGTDMWSETYDRDLFDIFEIQSDIAINITEAVKAAISTAEQEAIAKVPTDNLEAYAHYVKALSLMGTLQSLAPMHEELDAAIALDPDFALALATKAWLYSAELSTQLEGAEITAESQRRHADLARAYAERALAIDPDQGGAYYALALVDFYERRWERVHANFLRTYRLDPTNAVFTTTYAFNLTQLGQVDKAIPFYQRGFALDPRNWPSAYLAAEIMGGWGHIDIAVDYARRTIDLAPGVHYGYTILAKLAAMNGDLETALEMVKKAEALTVGRLEKITILYLMETYYWLRRPDDVARLFAQLQKIGQTQTLNHGDLFQANFALGDFNSALDHLEQAIEAHFPAGVNQAVGSLLATRYYEPLWGHPRYEAVLDELGVEDVFPRPKRIQGAINRP